jgi:hypothetical protein
VGVPVPNGDFAQGVAAGETAVLPLNSLDPALLLWQGAGGFGLAAASADIAQGLDRMPAGLGFFAVLQSAAGMAVPVEGFAAGSVYRVTWFEARPLASQSPPNTCSLWLDEDAGPGEAQQLSPSHPVARPASNE